MTSLKENSRTVTLKLARGEVIKLMIMLASAYADDPDARCRLLLLHEKIKKQCDEHDAKYEKGLFK